MQGGKSASAAASAKEAAANVGASAWAGKEKTKAVVEETVAKGRARDPGEKAAADARKQERVREVEAVKRDVMRQNAATKEQTTAAEHHSTTTATVREAEAGGGEAPVPTTDAKVEGATAPNFHNAKETTRVHDEVPRTQPQV